jgi:dihydroorotate dehydrogenase
MTDFLGFSYKNAVKPILFHMDAERVHNSITTFGEFLGNHGTTRTITDFFLNFQDARLAKTLNGLTFPNPVGLAAGFDYDGNLVGIINHVGFGFNTVGTITAKPYAGNTPPRMMRLPKSKSLLVNKGFKSSGVHEVAKKLTSSLLKNVMLGVSVGSSNVKEVDTVPKAIDDYMESFNILNKLENVKYYELNISCPNAAMSESFTSVKNFSKLLEELNSLDIKKPIFVKMPNELPLNQLDDLVKIALKNNINTFIFSNLVKDRTNHAFDQTEITGIAKLKGNFSGRPTHEGALKSIKLFRQKYQSEVILVGCGGIFSPEDVMAMFSAGADLVQLITGMIYEGPTLIKSINKALISTM